MNLEVLHVGPLGTNCYVAWDDNKNCAVVDCGGQAFKIIEFIEENGLKPQYMLLTHGHADHIGGVGDFLKKYPQVKVCIAQEDVGLIHDRVKNMGAQIGAEDTAFEADTIVKDGDIIPCGDMEFHVIATPGHTPGGVSYLKGNMLFCGDTLFQGSMGRTDLYGGDDAAMMQSLKKLAMLEGCPIVLPGHGNTSNLDDERRTNPFMKQAMRN